MSNASLKEQLQAMASQLSDTVIKTAPEKKPAAKSGDAARGQAKRPARPASKPVAKPAAPKPKWLEVAQYGVALLRSYFPGAFKPMSQIKPLKKGIKEDLVKRLSAIETIVTEDKACMVKSLSFYVNTAAYHRVVLEGALRLDLDGQPAGAVTAEEAKYSAEKLQGKQARKTAGATPPTTPSSSQAPSSSEEKSDEKTSVK